MEFASLQDAFPEIGNADEKKKKARKPKEGFQAYELPPTDADRPAIKRLNEVRPLGSGQAQETPDEYVDASTTFEKKMTVNNSLPAPRSTIQIDKQATPAFFGAEAFTNPNEDVMAPFNSHVDTPNGYMLDADFTKSFDQSGAAKAAGSSLPVPELRQRWKPLSSDRVSSSFVDTSYRKSDQFSGIDMSDMASMKAKLDSLMARLDDLEYRAEGANPQLEMLSFIMTGLFLMFILDISVRKTARIR
jgi:hypothetical protein